MERHLPAATVAQYLMVRLVDIWHFFQVHQTRCEKVFWLERLCGNLGDPSVCMQLRMKLLTPPFLPIIRLHVILYYIVCILALSILVVLVHPSQYTLAPAIQNWFLLH